MLKTTISALALFLSFNGVAQYACGHQNAHNAVAFGPSIQNNAKSDTVDILNYTLNLDLYNIASGQLKGACEIVLKAKLPNVSAINLDLLELNIDSIKLGASNLNYTYNDTLIKVNFPGALSRTSNTSITVYYQGTPQVDASGWGGFHRQSGYYFNLGVGFAADPHTYGRAWFPCFDNFVEKSTYSFKVKTKAPLRAFCNGLQQSFTLSGDTATSLFTLNQEIPTYLASVAVAEYQLLTDTLQTSNGSVPIWLMAKASDTANMKSSFRNLKPVTRSFIKHFGPYRWDKIGYAATTIGAMEHATSIHYPVNTINGNLASEDLLAHELAHHWWGNLITCKTDADMWINEGMAEFSSHLYAEQVYGRENYFDIVLDNAALVLRVAHSRDNGYKAIYGLDHEYTYGTHVYQKGAMVGHNLRAYLGYQNYDAIITNLMTNNAYGNLSTAELQQQLEQLSGKNLTSFFNNWVYNAGFPEFNATLQSGGKLAITQSTYAAPNLFQNVPLPITFFSSTGDTISKIYNVGGASDTLALGALPFTPAFALAGYNGKLLTANTNALEVKRSNGFSNLTELDVRLNFNNLIDSVRVVAQKHWAAPKGNTALPIRVSSDRYWTLQGFDWKNADMEARFSYNATDILQDDELVKNGEDSLALFYRPNGNANWTFYQNQNQVKGNGSDGRGYIEATSLLKGDYVLGNANPSIGINENKQNVTPFKVYPNPAKGKIKIELPEGTALPKVLEVNGLDGKFLGSFTLESLKSEILMEGYAKQAVFLSVGKTVVTVVLE